MFMFFNMLFSAARAISAWKNRGNLIDESGDYIVDESGNKILILER